MNYKFKKTNEDEDGTFCNGNSEEETPVDTAEVKFGKRYKNQNWK